ncbi:hypothetical protein H4Q26_015086 [Puccinia striiformis f. sp. tritici PST-130]|nr:hypothetical protein H4Q26_015086 [Puccinia striiformis f. sp. tritici PST-130]
MDYGKFLWIHDLAIDRFDHSSLVLLKEAESEKNLANQKVCRLLKAQLKLSDLCKYILESQPQYSLLSLEQQIEVLRQHLAPNLIDRPAFGQIEDLIEFYGLKANLEEQVEDSVITLDDIVPGRAQPALKSVWRKSIYMKIGKP